MLHLPSDKGNKLFFFFFNYWCRAGGLGGGAPREENYPTLKAFIISKIRLMVYSAAPSVLFQILFLIDKK